MFGGYANTSWKSVNNYVNDKKCFLFSLTHKEKLLCYQNEANAMYDHSSYGPIFGNGHDLKIFSNCNQN